jgi:methionine-rich copper-binding protein CopC
MKARIRCAAVIAATLLGAPILGCSQQPVLPAAAAVPAQDGILSRSNPTAGSTVQGPVTSLELHFKLPARLDEVTLSGPEGVMPTMVHAIGEVSNYSIPLSDLGPGSYTVSWRAIARGQNHRGSFGFTVK